MNFTDLQAMVRQGESVSLEFKKSTGQLTRSMETLCAFLNGVGGSVLVGVTDRGEIPGQHVSDSTRRDIAAALARITPLPPVQIQVIDIPGKAGHAAVALQAAPSENTRPYVFDGRAYMRVESSTRVMPQEEYQRLLLERDHARLRWENQPAHGNNADALDTEEILRTLRAGVSAGRLPEAALSSDPLLALDRLNLRHHGQLLNAAFVLFGRADMHDFPQCGLRLARFKGIRITDDFIDNRQLNGHAFQLLNEAMSFLHRHLPISGRLPPGQWVREDRLLIPAAALRESVINALCHRDYAMYGGSISIAVLDDRIEIWSQGELPFGLTPESLKTNRRSRPRNPLIADTFFRRGMVERWGRGMQLVADACLADGVPEPTYSNEGGSVVVRFALPELLRPESKVESKVESKTLPDLAIRILNALQHGPASSTKLAIASGRDKVSGDLRMHITQLLHAQLIAMTLPDKPSSRLQQYRLTELGLTLLEGIGNE